MTHIMINDGVDHEGDYDPYRLDDLGHNHEELHQPLSGRELRAFMGYAEADLSEQIESAKSETVVNEAELNMLGYKKGGVFRLLEALEASGADSGNPTYEEVSQQLEGKRQSLGAEYPNIWTDPKTGEIRYGFSKDNNLGYNTDGAAFLEAANLLRLIFEYPEAVRAALESTEAIEKNRQVR